MGIRFFCPNGHKLNVKAFQAGRRGICPFCGAKFQIPTESTLQPGQRSEVVDPPVASGSPLTSPAEAANAFEQDLEEHLQQVEADQVPQGESPAPAAWAAQPSLSNESESPMSLPLEEESAAADVESEDKLAPTNAATVSDVASETSPPATGPASVPTPDGSDPLAESPNAVWYVRPPSGGQFGPAQADMMRDWLNEGRVSPETLVWREGWADWQEAGSVFPQLQPAASGLPEAPPVAMSDGDAAFRPGSRRRRNGPNIGLLAVLVAAVLLLLFVLIWILTGGATKEPSEQDNSFAISVTECRISKTFSGA